MPGRKIRDAADARACLKAARSARGKSRAQWAREHGIDGRSLNAWHVNLSRRGKRAGGGKTRLVELVASPVAQPRRPAQYVVRYGELSIELDDHFNEQTLRRLLEVVAGC